MKHTVMKWEDSMVHTIYCYLSFEGMMLACVYDESNMINTTIYIGHSNIHIIGNDVDEVKDRCEKTIRKVIKDFQTFDKSFLT